MVYDDTLHVGDRIDLEVVKDSGIKDAYISQVQDMQDQDHIVVAGPIERGKIVLLSVGQPLGVLYYTPKGCYRFEAKVVERYKLDEDIYSYAIEAVGPRQRIQRRNYFRLQIVLPVQFRKMDKNSNEDEKRWHKAYTLDISGGGMRVAVSKRTTIIKGDLLQCLVSLDNNRTVDVCGCVIRISSSDAEATVQEIGIEFQDIPNKTRDQIIGFIFEQETKLRQRGLK